MFGAINDNNPESAARPADMIGRWDNYSYGNSNQIKHRGIMVAPCFAMLLPTLSIWVPITAILYR